MHGPQPENAVNVLGIDVGQGIDNVGVQPEIPLNLKNNNWLDVLLQKL